MPAPLVILVATQNPHKVQEIEAIFDRERVEGVSLRTIADAGFTNLPEPEELGTTFQENAVIKAVAYARATQHLCLADDSGLEIDALDGRPGVISSHYATDGAETGATRAQRDAANNARVLRELEGIDLARRTARFRCVMTLARPLQRSGGTGFQPVQKTQINQHPPGPLEKTRRNLPHWEKGGSTYFITFRVREGALAPEDRKVVLDACFYWHNKKAIVDLVTVMPDHVHMLISPLPESRETWHSLSGILKSIKGFTSRELNKRRGVMGASIWQDESYDRIVRHSEEFDEKWEYIRLNPARAGVVKHGEHYPFTRAGSQEDLEAHRLKACATRILHIAAGAMEGAIGIPPRVPKGDNGFGYDPLFLVAPDLTRTGAELESSHKNAISHRAAAAKVMAAFLRDFVASHQ